MVLARHHPCLPRRADMAHGRRASDRRSHALEIQAVTRPRKRYDDKFRANAIVMLEAAGYPNQKGALSQVSQHLSVPETTLHGWAREKHNPVPADIRTEKKGEIVDLLRAEIEAALGAAAGARPDANYRDLMTGIGIMVDKLQLLTNEPTENVTNRIVIEYDSADIAEAV